MQQLATERRRRRRWRPGGARRGWESWTHVLVASVDSLPWLAKSRSLAVRELLGSIGTQFASTVPHSHSKTPPSAAAAPYRSRSSSASDPKSLSMPGQIGRPQPVVGSLVRKAPVIVMCSNVNECERVRGEEDGGRGGGSPPGGRGEAVCAGGV